MKKIVIGAGVLTVWLFLLVSLGHSHKKQEPVISTVSMETQALPQEIGQGKEDEESVLEELIEPFGIATLTLLIATLSAGFMIKKNRAVIFPWHKRFALLTVSAAIVHFLLVLFFH